MFDILKLKLWQKNQYIPDIKNAKIKDQFRGYPILNNDNCKQCKGCLSVCPTGALSVDPLSINLNKCTFCGACERFCRQSCSEGGAGAIKFSPNYKLAADTPEKLIIKERSYQDFYKSAITARKEIKKIFGRSIKFRQVSAGGCNGCEMELNACSNANFDMGRFGIDFVASPRHADGIVITGPITKNMAWALEDCYKSTPNPKVVILTGGCALSGGVFQGSSELNREFLEKYKVDLYVPGCPVHPLTFINAVLDFIGR